MKDEKILINGWNVLCTTYANWLKFASVINYQKHETLDNKQRTQYSVGVFDKKEKSI